MGVHAVPQVSPLFFDPADYEIMEMVNKMLERKKDFASVRSLFEAALNPNGIKQLSVSSEFRMAHAIINLLGSLESGMTEERLLALATLRDEAMSADLNFRHNTGRALIQIMKDLVRAHGNPLRQLTLAHDFRATATGKRRIVRAMLKRYHLLEVPEEWNQLAFDNHVHDANTKGRKSPTHLIMDAWVKGIRQLTVIYYNYVEPEAAHELLHAAEIMGVNVRIGVEYFARYRGRYIKCIWTPRGFHDAEGFLAFLHRRETSVLMEEGRRVSEYIRDKVLERLALYNSKHRELLEKRLGVTLPEISNEEFLEFVGAGQASLLHLTDCVHTSIVGVLRHEAKYLRSRYKALKKESGESAVKEREGIAQCLAKWDGFGMCAVADMCRHDDEASMLPCPSCIPMDSTGNAAAAMVASACDPNMPTMLALDIQELLAKLTTVHAGYRFTLNLEGLCVEDVLSLLFAAKGKITHLELFNLKNASEEGATEKLQAISRLQQNINSGNVVALKRQVQEIRRQYDLKLAGPSVVVETDAEVAAGSGEADVKAARTATEQESRFAGEPDGLAKAAAVDAAVCAASGQAGDAPASQEGGSCLLPDMSEISSAEQRSAEFERILCNLALFQAWYSAAPLRSHIGSDSAGCATRMHGMGFVVPSTLPARARKSIGATLNDHRRYIPVRAEVSKIATQRRYRSRGGGLFGALGNLFSLFTKDRSDARVNWRLHSETVSMEESGEDIATLGGITYERGNGLSVTKKQQADEFKPSLFYMNSNLKNALKIIVGFIPAFLSFFLTQNWWVLAWFGAPLWFGITGFRNILQMVLGGGGLSRTPLLRWNNYVRWGQLADSLLYTGISVPLLDWVVKTLVLDHGFGITNATAPVLQYTFIALANGVYINLHNAYRGFPNSVIVGNYFRSVASIPLALTFNAIIGGVLGMLGVGNVGYILQQWAAVTSKAASDCVAGLVEGGSDRTNNLALRRLDYKSKIRNTFAVYAQLELLFPDKDMLELLAHPDQLLAALEGVPENACQGSCSELRKSMVINALDMMYFLLLQPRGMAMMRTIASELSPEERLVLWRSQLVLKREREVAQLVVDGLVGKKFGRALAFYLDQSRRYLKMMRRLLDIDSIVSPAAGVVPSPSSVHAEHETVYKEASAA